MKLLFDKTKEKLDSVENTLNISDMNKLKNILDWTKNNLKDVLLMWNNLLVDADVKSHITNIKNKLECAHTAGTLVNEIKDKVDDINTSGLPTTKKHKASNHYLDLIWWTLAAPWTGTGKNIKRRFDEYEKLEDKINHINIWSTIDSRTVKLWDTAFDWWSAPINLKTVFKNTLGSPNPDIIKIVDTDGKEIEKNWWKYKVKLWWVDIEIEWLEIHPWTWEIKIGSEFKISPNNVDLSKPLSLNIMGGYTWWSDTNYINVAAIKEFKLTIKDPNKQDSAKRVIEFNDYNNSWAWNKIITHLDTRNKLDLNKLERQAIERAVKDWDGPKYEQLSEGKKEQFYQQIRQLNHPVALTPFFSHLESIWNFNDYNSFRGWFTNDDKAWNKWDNISSKAKYRDFIHNNLESKSTEYISSQLDNEILKKHDINTFVKSELTKYLDEIEKNKVDSDVHTNVDSDLTADKHEMKKWPRSMITPRDENYMRFFSWSSISLENQKVNIDTNTSAEAVKKPAPVTYKMDLEVGSANRISVSIDIEWERKPIQVKAGDPTSLVRSVMKNQKISHGKVRAHIAFNIYKAMIQMAKSKDISLNYRNNANNHLNEIDLDKDWNIVVYDLDDWTNRSTNTKRITQVLFDQKMFNNTNDFDKAWYNWSLRSWIENISSHFNHAMNNVHQQYRKATKKRLRGMISSPSRPKLPSSIWLSPIKKMMNMWTNTNFDFDTTVDSNGKKISINFHKNKFTVTAEWLDKPIESRDLWEILNKRKQRKRIFDGMERDIVEWVYTAMIEKLRTNSKIARSNFWVTDDITWNMYILDSDWEFGMVTKEKLSLPGGNPLGRENKNDWIINTSKLLSSWYEKLNKRETKELLKNPFLMQKMMKMMNRRMWFWASMKAIFVK